MPICADTIVKIKFVKQTEQDKFLNVWPIGTYPVDQNNEIELILFIPKNVEDREEDTQAIFEKDEYFSVGGKIVPEKRNDNIRPKMTVATSTRIFINNVIPLSNRCPLKISLIGTAQESLLKLQIMKMQS